MAWLRATGSGRYHELVQYMELLAHERYLTRLLAVYHGPLSQRWNEELLRTRDNIAALESRLARRCRS